MAMNKVMLSGYLGGDPEVRTVGETTFCNFNLGVSRNYKNKEGKVDTDWIRCTASGKTAENISKFFNKGSFIIIDDAAIKTGSYTNKDGAKVFTTDVDVRSFQFGPKTGDVPQNSDASNNAGFMNIPEGIEEELPFN